MVANGDLVGHYRITGIIGRGAMATVYRAHDERLNRDVALKLLDQGYAMDFVFRARFEREYRVTALLHHDNIVPVYDAGTFGDQLYIAMMLVEGPNLAEVMKQEAPFSLARTVNLVNQIAAALDEAHEQRVIHRDVKPANVLLANHGPTDPEHVYLADFGLTLGMEGTHLTRTGAFMGTLAYTAPEQLNSAPIDGRADQYALAATTYQMLTGELPFRRDNEMALVNAQLFDPPPDIADARPDLPPKVTEVIEKGMAKRPEDRYRTATEFARALAGANARSLFAPTVVMGRQAAQTPGSGTGRAATVAIFLGIVGAAVLGAALTYAVIGLISNPPTSAPSTPSGSVPAIGLASPTTPATATDLPTGTLPTPQPSSSPSPTRTPTRTPKAPPPTPPTTSGPPDSPPPVTPPPALPLVAEGGWSVNNTPSGLSGDPYVSVGEHQRRYVITSKCDSEASCRLSVNTFDAQTGKRLGTIAFKWDGQTYNYRGAAEWYSHEGGSSCLATSGDVIADAYSTHEEVHVAPTTSGGLATQMTGTKTISGTPTAAGTEAGCAPFEMTYNVVMNAV